MSADPVDPSPAEAPSAQRPEPRTDPRSDVRTEQRPRRRRRAASVLPTLMTLGNVICGFAAIHYAAKEMHETAFGFSTLSFAGGLVFLGMFFDAIDGTVARLTRSTSAMGAQLDSLADVITFGVAPAFMTLRLVSHYYGPAEGHTLLGPADNAYAKVLWAIAAFYVCCTALRLARFNAEVRSEKKEDHLYFKGLPSPGAGGTVASLTLLHQHLALVTWKDALPAGFGATSSLIIPATTLLCALAMVGKVRYPHFVNRYLKGRKPLAGVAAAVAVVLLSVWWFHEALALALTGYALSGPVGMLARRRPAAEAGQ